MCRVDRRGFEPAEHTLRPETHEREHHAEDAALHERHCCDTGHQEPFVSLAVPLHLHLLHPEKAFGQVLRRNTGNVLEDAFEHLAQDRVGHAAFLRTPVIVGDFDRRHAARICEPLRYNEHRMEIALRDLGKQLVGLARFDIEDRIPLTAAQGLHQGRRHLVACPVDHPDARRDVPAEIQQAEDDHDQQGEEQRPEDRLLVPEVHLQGGERQRAVYVHLLFSQ